MGARDRENQVEDQHDDERWRRGRVHESIISFVQVSITFI